MAKLVTKFRYYKHGKRKSMGNYAKYIATREGVEKIDDSKRYGKSTKSQTELINKLIADFPDSKQMLEYEDYFKNPTLQNASEFISRCIEDNAMTMLREKTYADYIATRPRAEKVGSHGLFTDRDTEIILANVADELNKFEGNVYTMIVSLRREDAERLGFNRAQRWQAMLRSHALQFAEATRIPYDNLNWYAAFHNEGYHPHVHVMMWSNNPTEGYLSKEGIETLRSSLANDIFKDDLYNKFREQTQIRNTLKAEWRDMVAELISAVNEDIHTHTDIEQKLILLAEKLRRTSGKKIYGYLKADVKNIIDSIVDMLADDENISKLYDAWWEKKCEILRTYYQNPPQKKPPLYENKEFKSLKNDIIREALKIGEKLTETEKSNGDTGGGTGTVSKGQNKIYPQYVRHVSTTAVTGLLRSLATTLEDKLISDNSQKTYTDKRLRKEEEAKRRAEVTQV